MVLSSTRWILLLACWVGSGYGLRISLDAALRNRASTDSLRSVLGAHKVPRPRQALESVLLALGPRSAFSPSFDSHPRPRHASIWTPGEPLASPQANAGKLLLPSQEDTLSLIRDLRGPSPKMGSYDVPEMTESQWIESNLRLFEHRILHLDQQMDDWVINLLIAQMLYMDAQDSTKPIHLYINSPGGSVIAGLALYDAMQHINSPIYTYNIGMAASMASFLLAAGVKGKRIGLPDSRVMIHQPGKGGTAEDLRVEAEQILKIKDTVVTMYADMTGQTRQQIEKDLSYDNYMTAQQALHYGLIDYIPIIPDDK